MMKDIYGEIPGIVQIIPATDWYAVYDPVIDGVAKDSTDGEMLAPLACWVLMERIDGEGKVHRWVSGLDELGVGIGAGSGLRCTEVANFKEFRYDPKRGE